MSYGTPQGRPEDLGTDDPARYGRFRQLGSEFAKFAVIGVTGVFITNAVYDLLFLHLGVGPVTSTTIATVVAAIATYLGNRYWSFRARQRTGVVREIVVFAVLNGIGLLIQDAAVGFNYYLLHLGRRWCRINRPLRWVGAAGPPRCSRPRSLFSLLPRSERVFIIVGLCCPYRATSKV